MLLKSLSPFSHNHGSTGKWLNIWKVTPNWEIHPLFHWTMIMKGKHRPKDHSFSTPWSRTKPSKKVGAVGTFLGWHGIGGIRFRFMDMGVYWKLSTRMFDADLFPSYLKRGLNCLKIDGWLIFPLRNDTILRTQMYGNRSSSSLKY